MSTRLVGCGYDVDGACSKFNAAIDCCWNDQAATLLIPLKRCGSVAGAGEEGLSGPRRLLVESATSLILR